jgi:hypothetical protein
MPCDIIFVALILALSSSARHSASSLAMYLSSGLAGRIVVVADVVPGGVFPRDPHVPQHARGLGDLPLAVVGHEADLGVCAPTVVCRADLPPGGSPGTPSSASACPCPWPPVTAGRMVKGTTGLLTWPALPT